MKGLIAIVMLLASSAALAQGSYVLAPVTNVKPVYAEYYNTRTECVRSHSSRAHRGSHRNERGSIVGALLGAAIGYEAGKHSRNKDVIIGAGAAAGYMIGRNHRGRHGRHHHHHVEQECYPVKDFHQRLAYYSVEYEFNGHLHVTRMDHDPGPTVRVAVNHTVID